MSNKLPVLPHIDVQCTIQSALNYRSDRETCGECVHFVERGIPTQPKPKDDPDYCSYNPSFRLPVHRYGRCDEFEFTTTRPGPVIPTSEPLTEIHDHE